MVKKKDNKPEEAKDDLLKADDGPPIQKVIEKIMDSEGDDDEKLKKLRNILGNAQKKYQALIAKRDGLHEESNGFKAERNRLNRKKNGLVEEMKKHKQQRDKLVTEMRAHKSKRNKFQAQAKELIKHKRDKSNEIFRNLPGDIKTAEDELAQLDLQYQTRPLTLKQENKFIDNLRAKYKELDVLKNLEPQQQDLLTDIDDIDEKITTLFKSADDEHDAVVRLSEESQKYHDEMSKYTDEISLLITGANHKHEEFTEINDRATYYHERALQMRSQIVAIRRILRARAKEAQQIIAEQNVAVKKALEDDDKIDEAIDDALKKLKNKGKIEM